MRTELDNNIKRDISIQDSWNGQTWSNVDGCTMPTVPESAITKNLWNSYRFCVAYKKATTTPVTPPITPIVVVSAPVPMPEPFLNTMAGKVTIGVGALILIIGGAIAYKKFSN